MSGFEVMLARQLECCLHRFGTAGQQHDLAHARCTSDERVGEFFQRVGRKERRVRVGELVELLFDRRDDPRVTVAQT